jgi:hypothetical protein
MVAFAADRICTTCETRYTLPTPRWASLLFLVIGCLAAAGTTYLWLWKLGLLPGIRSGFREGEGITFFNLFFFLFGFVNGVLCLIYGIRSLRASGKITQPETKNDRKSKGTA